MTSRWKKSGRPSVSWRYGAGALFVALAAFPARAEHPNALWHVVHDLCVRDKQITGLAAPCVKVDLKAGYAIVPDPVHLTQLLVTPTDHIIGIESAELQRPQSPNYWAFAWAARKEFADRAGQSIAPDQMGLAVNARPSRTQDQLHIHLDCLRQSVRATLDAHADAIGRNWGALPVKLRGHRYSAMWVDDLSARDPFKLLADKGIGVRDNMALQTLAAAPTRRAGALGFVLLSRGANPAVGDLAAGEELLDHRCQILDSEVMSKAR